MATHAMPGGAGASPHSVAGSMIWPAADAFRIAGHMTIATDALPLGRTDTAAPGAVSAPRRFHCSTAALLMASDASDECVDSATASAIRAARSCSSESCPCRAIHSCVAMSPSAETAVSATASMTSISDVPRLSALRAEFTTMLRTRPQSSARGRLPLCECSAANGCHSLQLLWVEEKVRSCASCRSPALPVA